MPRVYLNDFKGLVTDVGFGKAPLNTFADLKNVRRDIRVGSLSARTGYEVSGLDSPNNPITDALSLPITYPSQQDINVWFGGNNTYQRPYFNTVGDTVNSWLNINESAILSGTTNYAVSGNLLTINYGTGFTLNSSKPENYYKNWVIEVTQVINSISTLLTTYFVKASTWSNSSGGQETYTLTHASNLGTYLTGSPNTYSIKIKRFFHSNYNVASTYSNPHGYSTDVAVRWSGGKSSLTTNQNIWSGYLDKTFFPTSTSPLVTIDGGGGYGATASSVTANQVVTSVLLINNGTNFTEIPIVTISAPTSGTTATATAVLSGVPVLSINATLPTGTGYLEIPTVTISAPPIGGVQATAICTISGGYITGFSLTNHGSGYTSAPTVTIIATGEGGGSGATATTTIPSMSLNSIIITNPGSGYTTQGYEYKGTYVDYAEIKAPAISLITANPSETSIITYGGGSVISNVERNSYFKETSVDWVDNNNTQKYIISKYTYQVESTSKFSKEKELTDVSVPALKITSIGQGTINDAISLTTNNYTQGIIYTVQIGYVLNQITSTAIIPTLAVITGGVANIFSLSNAGVPSTAEAQFINGTSGVKLFFNGALSGADFFITFINIYSAVTTTTTGVGIEPDKTYRLFISSEYDGFQESELTSLSSVYVKNNGQKLAFTISIPFAELNKRISAYKIYLAIDSSNTTGRNTTTSPKYLVKTIYLIGDSASTFTTNGINLILSTEITKEDINNSVYTWEQRTGRTASTSTTCSYSVARMVSGRVFIAQDYDYKDAKGFANRLRYTGFNGDGIMCPDVFPNIFENGIINTVSGSGYNINNLTEFNGNCVIVKDNSIVLLNSSDIREMWRFDIVSDVIGGLGKNSALKTDRGLIFAGEKDIYLWSGGILNPLTQGIWKTIYSGLTSTEFKDKCFLWFNSIDGHLYIAPNTTSSPAKVYSFLLPDTLPQEISYSDNFKNYFKKGSGEIVGVLGSGTSYKFSNATTDRVNGAITITAETNYIMPDNKSSMVISEIFAELELSDVTNNTLYIYDEAGEQIQNFIIGGNASRKFWRFPVKSHAPTKAVKLKLSMASVNSKINGVGFDYEIQPEGGDVSYTA